MPKCAIKLTNKQMLYFILFLRKPVNRFQGVFLGLGVGKSPWERGCKPVANLIDAFVIFFFVKSHVAGQTKRELVGVSLVY